MSESEMLFEAVQKATSFSSDSRKLNAGSLFVALRGATIDGHQFIDQALAKGAIACICEKGSHSPHERILFVEDTAIAHREIARMFRERFKGKVIGIGGSNGKTSTKDFLFSLLSSDFKSIKTESSQNGFQGIPLTLEKLHADLSMAIIEIGTDGPGDIASHCRIVKPDIVVLTSIGEEHLRLLKNLEGVFKEEIQLAEDCLSRNGHVFVPTDDPWLSRIIGRPNVHAVPSDPRKLATPIECPKDINGIAQRNFALAAAVALHLGMSKDQIMRAAQNIALPKGRGGLRKLNDGTVLIEDHYNANLSSMIEAFQRASTISQEANMKLVFVLGDMLDLGEDSVAKHEELAMQIKKHSPHMVIGVGDAMNGCLKLLPNIKHLHFENSKKLAEQINAILPRPSIALFKGSRGIALETALTACSL